MPTGSVSVHDPAQTASAATISTPRLWLKLKPIQARHMSVRPPDSLRADCAIACATEGSARDKSSRVAQIEQSVNGMQGAYYTEYRTAEDEQAGDHR
jgi:hypothetical protein